MATHTVDYNSENPKEKKKSCRRSFPSSYLFFDCDKDQYSPPYTAFICIDSFYVFLKIFFIWCGPSFQALSLCVQNIRHIFNSPCRISYATRHTPGPFVLLFESVHPYPSAHNNLGLDSDEMDGPAGHHRQTWTNYCFCLFFYFLLLFFFWPVMGGSIAIDSNERARTPRMSKKEETINILTGGHCWALLILIIIPLAGLLGYSECAG